MIIKEKKYKILYLMSFFYFSFNIMVCYLILKLRTLRTQIFLNFEIS